MQVQAFGVAYSVKALPETLPVDDGSDGLEAERGSHKPDCAKVRIAIREGRLCVCMNRDHSRDTSFS